VTGFVSLNPAAATVYLFAQAAAAADSRPLNPAMITETGQMRLIQMANRPYSGHDH